MISQHAQKRHARKARIEMVPLIDCMFLLLTFFIYVATTFVVQQGIPMDLATASTAEAAGKERFATVSIDRSGHLYLNEDPITQEQLRKELSAMAMACPPKPVVLQADKGVVHEQVVGVLDLARQCGVPQVVFAVEPPPSRREGGAG